MPVFTRVFEPLYRPSVFSVGFDKVFLVSGQVRFEAAAIAFASICVQAVGEICFKPNAKTVFLIGDFEGGIFLRGTKRFAISEDFSGIKTVGRQSVFRFSEDGPKVSFSKGQSVFSVPRAILALASVIFER